MILPFVTKLLAGLFCYFSVACAFDAIAARPLLCLGTICACVAAGACCCALRRRTAVRVVVALLPFLSLFFTHTAMERVITIIPAAYTAVLCIYGMFRTDRWAYGSHFQWSSISLCGYLLLMCVVGKHAFTQLLFGTAGFLFGAFTLRQLRIGEGTTALERGMDALELAAIPAAAAVTYLVTFAIPRYFERLFSYLMLPFTWPYYALIWLLEKIPDGWFTLPQRTQPETTPVPDGLLMQPVQPELGEGWATRTVEADWLKPTVLGLLIACGVALLLWILWLVYRKRRDLSPEDVYLYTEDAVYGRTETGTRQRLREKSGARSIRRIYAKYLKLCAEYGYPCQTGNTTEELLARTEEGLSETDSSRELRRLYIRARYRTGEPVREAEARQAKQLLEQIKRSFENGRGE